MSIESEINRIKDNVADSYAVVAEKGGTVPELQNSNGLSQAINSIPQGEKFSPDESLTLKDGILSVTTPVNGIYTQDDYDALSEEQKNKGMYIINNGDNIGNSGGNSGVPSGCILIWSGAIDTIPNGWALCDGTNGTPNLKSRFVYGAGDKNVGETGGSEEVTLTVEQMPSHTHTVSTITSGSGVTKANHCTAWGKTTGTFNFTSTGSTDGDEAHSNMPPYYVLAYIMKL